MRTRPSYIVGSKRVPFFKSMSQYRGVSTQELMTASLKAVVEQYGLRDKEIGDVALGAVMNASSKWGLAREAVIDSGLSRTTPAVYVQRACGTSLQTLWDLSLKIEAGQMDEAIAGGVDTNSDVPIEVSNGLRDILLDLSSARTLGQRLQALSRFRPHHLAPKTPAVAEPRTGLSMGQHTEKMVREWKISREEQDAWALRSHQDAAKAYDTGFYSDLLTEFKGFKKDGILRADTTLAKLATLKPAFRLPKDPNPELATLTAGNSSALTDGSAAVLVASEEGMRTHGWRPLARIVDFQVAAVDFVNGAGLLMAPTVAVARLIERQKLKLQDFDIYEIHEAFAGQVLCTLRAWESDTYAQRTLKLDRALGPIDRDKINPVGSSLALGHPFSATGARIAGSIAKQLFERSRAGKKARGLISICTAGGMGVAAILETV